MFSASQPLVLSDAERDELRSSARSRSLPAADVQCTTFHRYIPLVPGQDPERVADVARATARRIWREAPDHALALELGISSWEALWSGLDGGHPVLDGLRTWSRDYASGVWRETLAHFGAEDHILAD